MARKRKVSGRKLKKSILILCEGEKSEILYLKGLKQFNRQVLEQNALKIQIGKTEKNTPYELVEQIITQSAAEERKGNYYDELWVVFDKDGHPKLHDTFQLARLNNVKISFSSLCFEYWLLLHFTFTTRAFDTSKKLTTELKKFYPQYEKNNVRVYLDTYEQLNTAMSNTKNLRKLVSESHHGQHVFKVNPYLNTDNLIETLLKPEAQYSIQDNLFVSAK